MKLKAHYLNLLPAALLAVLLLAAPVAAQRYNNNSLNGTWRLDTGRSDNLEDVIGRATSGLSSAEQQRMRNMLSRRLAAPDTLAIERSGRRVTMASTLAPQVTFDANGRTSTETNQRGRTTQINAALSGNQLTITTTGDRGNDFNVTFAPFDNGRGLRVTRRIYAERLAQPITVASVYEKTSDLAQWNIYEGRDRNAGNWNDRNNPNNPNNPNNRNNDTRNDRQTRGTFYVPNNTQLTAVLNERLDTKTVRAGDRFTLTVRRPGQYDGATIEGVIREADRAGRFTGRAELAFDFERIRLRNGGTYDFAAYIESARTPNGETIKVDNEGSVKENDSQTQQTVTRTGIGAALGAIIGAIAGGGSGAAIGAAVGAGAGAGSVFITGRDDLELPAGTEMTIRSSAPSAQEARRQ